MAGAARAVGLLAVAAAGGGRAGALVSVRRGPRPCSQLIVVEPPAATPADGPVWISGDLPALGSWNGAGVRLERGADGR